MSVKRVQIFKMHKTAIKISFFYSHLERETGSKISDKFCFSNTAMLGICFPNFILNPIYQLFQLLR